MTKPYSQSENPAIMWTNLFSTWFALTKIFVTTIIILNQMNMLYEFKIYIYVIINYKMIGKQLQMKESTFGLRMPYFLNCSLTTLLYMKAAPLNCGKTNHATNISFAVYHIGILYTFSQKKNQFLFLTLLFFIFLLNYFSHYYRNK